MKFLEAFGTPGGRTALIAFLWLLMMMMIFTIRLMKIEMTPEGIAAIARTSDVLLGILIYSMGGQAPKPPSDKAT